jgi:DNA repair protein RecN (Recombination protein N)
MLNSLRLRNIATISDTSLDLGRGLNVLSGETGAGKSILIDGLLLALGERADYSLVRPGAKAASVEASFSLPDGSEMLVRREISGAGRSRLLIDDEVASLEDARERIGDLVDLHTQRSTPALLGRRFQQQCLDAFAGAADRAGRVRDLYRQLCAAVARIEQIRGQLESAASERELMAHESSQIDELGPSLEEYNELLGRRRALEKAETLSALYGRGLDCISGDDGGMLGSLSALRSMMEKSDVDFGDIPELVSNADIALREASSRFAALLAGIEGAPWMIEQIDERLDRYGRLLSRHGGDISRLLLRRDDLAARMGELASLESELEDTAKKRAALESDLSAAATGLSKERRKAVPVLEKSVVSELRRLGMPGSAFIVRLEAAPADGRAGRLPIPIGPDGAEIPEFAFTANEGLPPGPISSVASGGELSRLSLALMLALSGAGGTSTLVFDEIDSGVGGETAVLLADSLLRASTGRQTVVITHLPQIASRADRHLAVSKAPGEGLPVTSVRLLEGDERTGELARMLGGDAAALEHARALLSAGRSS